jgi:hypothetical protein
LRASPALEIIIMRVYFEIQDKGTSAYACVGTGGEMLSLDNLELGEQAKVRIKGKDYTLGSLVRMLIEFKDNNAGLLDERDQLEIGRYLYNQTIAKLPPAAQKKLMAAKEVILHIYSPDEHINRLPWVLLVRDQDLLINCAWSVVLSSMPFAQKDDKGLMHLCSSLQSVELPPSPRMLIIAPQPKGISGTEAEAHLHDLQTMLKSGEALMEWGRNLRLVKDWDEFIKVLPEFEPHLIYYYGHGISNKERGFLLFADAQEKRKDVAIIDFAGCVNKLNPPPFLVYVNCCQGDAAGFLSVGRQVHAPAVLTNRTKAIIPAARAQAMAFWEAVILKGQSPHRALQQVYMRTAELELSHADVRWMTPVLYGHYHDWKANPSKAAKHWVRDEQWHLKVDRIQQFATVTHLTREMLRNKRPRCLFFVWYGKEGEGIELFHERLVSELDLDLPDHTELYTVEPAWPDHLFNPEILFREIALETFGVTSIENIPARIREQNKGERQVLTYLNHQTVITRPYTSKEMLENTINPQTLHFYFEWCDRLYPDLLEPGQYLLVGISFVVKDPPKFREWFRKTQQNLDLQHSVVRLLDEMEILAEEDLKDFLHFHNIPLPADRRDEVIKSILKKTGGSYERTVIELENWLGCGLAVEEADKEESDGFVPFEV